MADKHHVAGAVSNDGIGMGRRVVEKLFHLLHSVFCRIGLLRSNGSQDGEHSEVNCMCVV